MGSPRPARAGCPVNAWDAPAGSGGGCPPSTRGAVRAPGGRRGRKMPGPARSLPLAPVRLPRTVQEPGGTRPSRRWRGGVRTRPEPLSASGANFQEGGARAGPGGTRRPAPPAGRGRAPTAADTSADPQGRSRSMCAGAEDSSCRAGSRSRCAGAEGSSGACPRLPAGMLRPLCGLGRLPAGPGAGPSVRLARGAEMPKKAGATNKASGSAVAVRPRAAQGAPWVPGSCCRRPRRSARASCSCSAARPSFLRLLSASRPAEGAPPPAPALGPRPGAGLPAPLCAGGP